MLFHCFQNEREYSMMLAVPCGRDVMDIIQQSSFLKDGFIKYLQEKQAAGIVNVPAPGTNQVCYHYSPERNRASLLEHNYIIY